jgi:diguanylate cyclase (GGDEF)-like protein
MAILKPANTDIPTIVNTTSVNQMITFDTFKYDKPKECFDNKDGDMIHRNVIDALHVPAVIVRLSDARVMYYNKKAQEKFNISDVAAIKMSDLYVNKEDYHAIANAVSRNNAFEDFETSLQSLGGQKIHVTGSANMVWYKGERCKFVSFQDITAEKEYKNMALTDHMTGIHNRLSFSKESEAEFIRSKRYGHKMSVLMLDVDYFKQVNDEYGHKAGDDALIALAQKVSSSLRSIDVFGRVGGEEFAIILPETSLKAAEEIAERIRADIKTIKVASEKTGVEFDFTVSIGITSLNHKDADVEETIHRADMALYEAKGSGRDKVVIK